MITVVIVDRLGKGQNVAKGVEQAGGRVVVVLGMGVDICLGDVMQQEKADSDISFCGSGDAGALMAATEYGYLEGHGMQSIEEGVTAINDGKAVLGFGFMDQEESGKRIIEVFIKKHGAQKVVTQKGAVIIDATRRSAQAVIVSGKGNKKNEAFASVLNDVSGKVLKETIEVLTRIEPKRVAIRQTEEQVYTEKLLLFFFLRKRVIYHVELAAEMKVQAIVIEEVGFLMETIKGPNAVIAPFLSKRGA